MSEHLGPIIRLKFANEVRVGRSVTPMSQESIKATPGLWHASLDDALRYGGEVTKHVLAHMNLRGDRKHIVVDTKVHMLMPGFMPAIPGWHTDGVPRWDGEHWNPESGDPSLAEQAAWEESGEAVAPRYHLYVSGKGCLTRFLAAPVELEVPESGPDTYAVMSQAVNEAGFRSTSYPGRVIEWDWWSIHSAVPAATREWRFLCRVTETDLIAPQPDLRQVIRTQEQVYVPAEFGW